MKLLVCGGRDFDDIEFVTSNLNNLYTAFNVNCLIAGGAKGVDTIAEAWADEMGIEKQIFHAEWSKYQRRAGPIRNQRMLDEGKPDAVIAFPGGKGTDHMWRIASLELEQAWRSKRVYFKKEEPETWFLSNFADGLGFYDLEGRWWDTSEHYYQAMKSPKFQEQEYVRESEHPAEAKRRGNEIKTYDDWDERKIDVMRHALRYKFTPGSNAARLLKETGIDYLIEWAPWGDRFWGVDRHGAGQNMLGKLLMERRNEL